MKLSLHRALLLLSSGTLVAALVPAGIALERRIAAELRADAREDLAMAPPLLADRQAGQAETLRMHAREVARRPEIEALLAGAAGGGPSSPTISLPPGEELAVLGPDGVLRVGGRATGADPEDLVARGDEPLVVEASDGTLYRVALSPAGDGGSGAGRRVGVAVALDRRAAEVLAGLTRSDVILVGPHGAPGAATVDPSLALRLAAPGPARRAAGADGVTERDLGPSGRYWTIEAPLEGEGAGAAEGARAIFARSVAAEMAALPRLRRAALLAAALALALTLALGALFASTLARPVRALAAASDRLAGGDFEAPLPASRIDEVERVSGAFAKMRESLAARLRDLEEANRELADRQDRLTQLQAEMIQRDRLVAAGRLVTELAHEIRNPVANVRNCLEVVRRHVDDEKAREFTELAVDELLRMHDLAERILDLNRPAGEGPARSDPVEVAEQVAALARLGEDGRRAAVQVRMEGETRCPGERRRAGPDSGAPRAEIPADALKQVLLGLVTNAREAAGEEGTIEIRIAPDRERVRIAVLDDGPGFGDDVLPRAFDPFFTTKPEVHGVGLGLFIADGVVRRWGGRLEVGNREEGGARVELDLPRASR